MTVALLSRCTSPEGQAIYYTNMDCCRVQWYDLLHCGNVILPKAKITHETLVFPDGFSASPFSWSINKNRGKYEGLGQYDVTTVQ